MGSPFPDQKDTWVVAVQVAVVQDEGDALQVSRLRKHSPSMNIK